MQRKQHVQVQRPWGRNELGIFKELNDQCGQRAEQEGRSIYKKLDAGFKQWSDMIDLVPENIQQWACIWVENGKLTWRFHLYNFIPNYILVVFIRHRVLWMERLLAYFFSSDNFCHCVTLDELFIEFLARRLSLFYLKQKQTKLKNNMILRPLLLCLECID